LIHCCDDIAIQVNLEFIPELMFFPFVMDIGGVDTRQRQFHIGRASWRGRDYSRMQSFE